MRVLLICAAFPPYGKGGGPVTSHLVAKALAEGGAHTRVLTIGDDPRHECRGDYELRVLASPNVYWDYWKPNPLMAKLAWHALENFNPRALQCMGREIDEFDPDIVITISSENINVATWLAARRKDVPVVHMLQSYVLLCWRATMYRAGANCARQCGSCAAATIGKRSLARYVDAVCAESRFVIERHLDAGLFRKAMTRVVPSPVSRVQGAERSSESRKSFRVGYIGHIGPTKGLETLARAAHVLAAEPVEFRIAGTGERRFTEAIRQRFPPARTTFLGWVDADEFYRELDVVVVPSLWHEPFGRVSVEPLAYGVPVLAARSGGLPENVAEGRSGWTFDPGDHDEVARRIKQLLRDHKFLEDMKATALAHSDRFNSAKFSSSLMGLLRDVRERSRRQPVAP